MLPISFELPQASPTPVANLVSFEVASAVNSDRHEGENDARSALNERRGDSASNTAVVTPTARSVSSAISQGLNAALQDPINVASAGLSVGILWWISRAGGLIASVILIGAPAWRHVDLLPVLGSMGEDDADEDLKSGDLPPSELDANGHDEADEAALMSMFERRAG